MLTNQKKLAKTSSRPGKTQLINHFLINDNWYLVDLPGYGWAKVSKEIKSKWGDMIESYFLNRKNLLNIFVLIDSRLQPQDIDIDFINWLGMSLLPFSIVFTKTDKLSKSQVKGNIFRYQKTLEEYWEEVPPIFESSAMKNTGRKEILDFIGEINSEHQNTFTFA